MFHRSDNSHFRTGMTRIGIPIGHSPALDLGYVGKRGGSEACLTECVAKQVSMGEMQRQDSHGDLLVISAAH